MSVRRSHANPPAESRGLARLKFSGSSHAVRSVWSQSAYRRLRIVLPTLLAFCVACSPKIERVYVDLSLQPAESVERSDPTLVKVEGVADASFRSQGRGAGTLLFGISEERYLAAIRENQNARLASSKALSDTLFGALDAQIEDARRASRLVLSKEEEVRMNDAISRTRPVFEKYADDVGRLTRELSVLAGFPDRGPSGDPEAAKAKRAQEIRSEIKSLETSYLAEREAILNEVRSALEARRRELDAQLEKKRAADARRIQANVEAMLSRGVADAVGPVLQRLQFSIPASAGLDSRLKAAPGRTEIFQDKLPRPTDRQAIRSQAETWAALNGYKLNSDPRGVADKTKEFWAWRTALQHGP